ncbi:hypothetical protein [uncultured Alistipes sp.]|jgi:hypothetical protein|uniref:hypothetical protein n=1 Tax=uncultured Alistipes sp. TaxID=538949 RepID=UPI0025E4B17E|nr:hypothetical protein [uncultured Alistipes sp.]
MNRLFAFILAPLVLLCGCSNEEDILPGQKEKVVNYLKTTHIPKLVAEADREEGSSAEYYTESGNTVYRYIQGIDNEDRQNRTEVTSTSRVSVTFSAYVFTYANIQTTGETLTMPYYSNDAKLQDAFIKAGLNTEYWSFEPIIIDMSSPGTIKGIYLALLGCREGDYVETYITYNMAYGDDNYFGMVPKESPVAYFFTVNSVR